MTGRGQLLLTVEGVIDLALGAALVAIPRRLVLLPTGLSGLELTHQGRPGRRRARDRAGQAAGPARGAR